MKRKTVHLDWFEKTCNITGALSPEGSVEYMIADLGAEFGFQNLVMRILGPLLTHASFEDIIQILPVVML